MEADQDFSRIPKRHQQEEDEGRQLQRTTNREQSALRSWHVVPVTLTLIALTVALFSNEKRLTEPSWSQDEQKVRQNIHTILVTAPSKPGWMCQPRPTMWE